MPNNGRTLLAGPRTYYVSPAGLDTNSGLSTSVPWKTLQHAWDTISTTLDQAGNLVTIRAAAGTYAPLNAIISPTGRISIIGNEASPGTCLITAVGGINDQVLQFNAVTGAVYVSGFTLNMTNGSGGIAALGSGFTLALGANIYTGDNTSQWGNLIWASYGARVNIGSELDAFSYYDSAVAAGGYCFAQATFGAVISISSRNITVSNSPAFTYGFVSAGQNGSIEVYYQGTAITGASTGKRFVAEDNGTIFTSGAPPTYFPGDADGQQTNGGVYV